jgi:D-psicose/D-tagatose/L-ribulose 3-epimerase
MYTQAKTTPPLAMSCLVNVFIGDASVEALPGMLDSLGELGYTYVVLPPMDPDATDVGRLRGLCADRGLLPITMSGGLTPETQVGSANSSERAAGAAGLRKLVDFAVALGSPQLNGVPYGVFGHPTRPTDSEFFARAAREVGAVADYAYERGVTMTFEVLNRYETSVVNTAAQALEFTTLSESDHLKIHLDTFHMAIEEADMFAAIDLAMPRLGYLELGQSGRGFLSTGIVDNAAVVKHALGAGYAGPIGVEAFSRSILPSFVADALAIWREPYASGEKLAGEAVRIMHRGAGVKGG